MPGIDLTVIGVGNTLMGDDGIGSRIVERLADDPQATAGGRIEYLHGGAGGLRLLNWIEQANRLLFIDAARFASPEPPAEAGGYAAAKAVADPGACRLLRPDRLIARPQSERFSLHETDLAGVLALAKQFYRLPPTWLLAIRVERVEQTERLSPELSAVLPRLVETTKRLAQKLCCCR